MNFHAAIDSTVAQYLTNRRVSDFLYTVAILDFRINDANLVLEKGRQITAAKIAIFVNCRRQHRSTIGAIPCRVVGSPAEKRNTKWRPANDHGSTLHSLPSSKLRMVCTAAVKSSAT